MKSTQLKKRIETLNWSLFLIIICASMAILVLIGWTFSIEFLKRPLPGQVAMNPLTATFFICLSFSLFLKTKGRNTKYLSLFSSFLALTVLVFSAIKLSGDILGIDLGIDTYLFHDGLTDDLSGNISNRMAPNTASAFILSSLAILFLSFKIGKNHVPAQFIAILIGAIGLLSVLGYLYNLRSFYGVLELMPMAIHSAICFLLLSFSILLSNRKIGFMKEVTSDLIGAKIIRKLLPAAILIPVGLGFVRLYLATKIELPVELGVGILIVSNVLLTLVFIWFIGRELNSKSIKQKEIEQTTKKVNDRMKLANKSSGVGIWEWDVLTNYVIWDEQVYHLYGLSPETPGNGFDLGHKAIHPEDSLQVHTVFQEALAKGTDFTTEFRVVWPDKSIHYLKAIGNIDRDEAGNIIRFVGTNWDITKSKQSEEKLIQYKHFFTNSNDLSCIANSEGYLELLNPNFELKLGYTIEELTETPFVNFIHPDDLAPTMETYAQQVDGASVVNFANRYRKKDGGYIWLDWNAVTDKETGKLYCVARDISDQKSSADELTENNIFLDTIIENIPNMLFVKDAKDLNFVRFNKAGAELLGYKKEDLIGKNDFDFFTKEQAEDFQRYDRQVLEAGVMVEIEEEKAKTATGERWLRTKKIPVNDKHGKPLFLLGISEDITEQKILNDELKKNLKEISDYKYALDEASIVAITDQKGIIKYVNDNFCKISKYSKEELIGQDHSLLNSDFHSEEFIRDLWVTIANGKIWNGDIKNKAKDGSIYWVETTIIPFLDEKGKPFQYLAIRSDITERIIGEVKLKENFKEISTYKNQLQNQEIAISLSNAIVEFNLDGTVLDANDNFASLFGYSLDEIKGKSHDIFLPEKAPKENRSFWKQLKKGEFHRGEFKRIAKDGSPIWIVGTYSPVYNTDNKLEKILKIVTDVSELKKVEHALFKSNELFAEVFNHNPASISISRLSDKKLTTVNQSFLNVFGFDSTDQVYGKTAQELNLLTDPNQREEIIQELAESKKSLHKELFLNTHHGEKKWVSTSSLIIEINNEPCLFNVLIDITDRKIAEERLIEFQHFFNSTHGLAFIADLEGNIEETNPNFDLLLGYKSEEVIQQHIFNFLHPDDIPRAHQQLLLLNEGEDMTNLIVRVRKKSGEYLLFDWNGIANQQSGKFYAMSRDITEQKIAEEKLMEFKHFFNNSNDMAGIFNLNGLPEILNPNFTLTLGYPEEVLYENPIFFFIHPDDLENAQNELVKMSQGIPLINFEFRLRKHNGTYGWFEANATSNIESGRLYAIVRDTTERKSKDQLLIKQATNLKAVNEELEAFSYSVSHDLRAPLRSLQGFSKALTLKYNGKMDEDANRWLQFIESNASQMGKLINDMLAFSKITRTEINKTNIDMKSIAQDVFDAEALNYVGQTIHFDLNDLSSAHGDPGMIRQVWQNLISNALKYSQKKKEIIINISSETKGGFNIYTVEDNGAGFDEKYKEKLFVVFQRLHAHTEFEGTGVGLAIANRIVKKHGGNITASSKLEIGTKFTFTLPIE